MNIRIIQLIAGLLRSDTQPYQTKNTAPRPAAALRLATAFLCILLCALSWNAWFPLAVIAAELARICLKPPASISRTLRPVLIAVLFAAVFTLPAVLTGSPGTFGNITLKVAESVMVLSLLNEEVPWKEMTGAFRAFHLPDIFTITLDAAIRYLVILGRFSNAMLEAVSLRRVGRRNWKNAGTGGIVGTTFLKSRQLSARTTEAMLCRGFTGEFRGAGYRRAAQETDRRKRLVNAAYLLLPAALLAGFLYTQSLV